MRQYHLFDALFNLGVADHVGVWKMGVDRSVHGRKEVTEAMLLDGGNARTARGGRLGRLRYHFQV